MTISEKRFREGTGERYLLDGRIRCQSISISQMRKWREAYDDYDTPNEYLWPECQCTKGAVEGLYVCIFHGGKSHIKKIKPNRLQDVLPLNLSEKIDILLNNPTYISRHEDIALIQARIWDLMEQLQEQGGGNEAWGLVANGLTEINRGREEVGYQLIRDALQLKDQEKDIWQEFYKAETVLKDMTRTQVSTMKDLQAMATVEQVSALVQGMISALIDGANKYIEEDHRRAAFIGYVSNNIAKLANISPGTAFIGLDDSSGKTDGNPIVVDQ